MHTLNRLLIIGAAALALTTVSPVDTGAQGRGRGPAPRQDTRRPPRPPARQSVVFIGGYFYDPFFGPYPWWHHGAYPYGYYPVYDNRAVIRVIATPKDAEVYVDGFYAGTVHDFNDWFQGLPLPPGGHEIVLFLDGYRTTRDALYLSPGQTVKLHRTLERLQPGERSDSPALAPPVPVPPSGTYMPPRSPRRLPPPPLDDRMPDYVE